MDSRLISEDLCSNLADVLGFELSLISEKQETRSGFGKTNWYLDSLKAERMEEVVAFPWTNHDLLHY